MSKWVAYALGIAAGLAAAPFLILWWNREKIASKVIDAALFATTWLLVSKLFKALGWLP